MSTNKTQNYQLHKWEADDDFLRSEFNENFVKIDESLYNHVVTGTYTGDGEDQRVISLGFTPRAVLVQNSYSEGNSAKFFRGGLALEGQPCQYGSYQFLTIVDGGFRVRYLSSSSMYLYLNTKDLLYYYVALR